MNDLKQHRGYLGIKSKKKPITIMLQIGCGKRERLIYKSKLPPEQALTFYFTACSSARKFWNEHFKLATGKDSKIP